VTLDPIQLLVLVLKTSGQVSLLQNYKLRLLFNAQMGQVSFSQKKILCGSRRRVNEMQIYEAGWQKFGVIIFPF